MEPLHGPCTHAPISSRGIRFDSLSEVDSPSYGPATEAATEPANDFGPPTRELKRRALDPDDRPLTPITTLTSDSDVSSVAARGPTLELSFEALKNEERGRLRVTAQVSQSLTWP